MLRFVVRLSLFFALSRFSLAATPLPEGIYPNLREGEGLIPAVAPHLGQNLKPYVLPSIDELLQKRENFGYTTEEITKYFHRPVTMVLDETGLDRSLLKTPPAPGIHPRVLFNPEDLPGIRERLATSQSGQAIMQRIRAHLEKELTGPSALGKPNYERLVQGDETVAIYEKTPPLNGFIVLYEALRCLIDDDQVGGRKVAAAITTLAKLAEKELDKNIAAEKAKAKTDFNDFRVVAQGPSFEGTLGLDYDFAYNFMTDAQRAIVRQALARCSAGMTNIGCETLRAAHAGASNWVSWSNRLIFVVTAIEKEEGYDPATYKRCEEAQTNFINTIYASGEAYEGWGKNFMFLEHMIVMGKRGNDLIASNGIRAAYNDYFVQALSPWGNSFTFCDSLGGTGVKVARNADAVMYHALYPQDTCGDFILRNQLDGGFNNIFPGRVNTRHPFAVMDGICDILFARDLRPIDWESEFAQVTQGRSLTYFSDDTGNLITRASWDKNSLYLNYLTRTVPGGHQYCDRSHFSLYGQGRTWSTYHIMRQVHDQYLPHNRSVLLADGEGPSVAEGKCAAFVDRPLATFTATDLSITWNYQTQSLVKPPANTKTITKPWTYNELRLHPSPLAWMNLPIGELPNWYTSEKPVATKDDFKDDWYPRPVPVVKAFRTAGLVRGPHAYCLIVDDLQKDQQPHRYEWGMTLDDDVILDSATITGKAAHPEADIILGEAQKAAVPALPGAGPPANDRHLLVRVLEAAQLDAKTPATAGFYSVENHPQKDMRINKLQIPSQSISPNFKMLLFAYRQGDLLPTTTWNADQTAVEIRWPDQSDRVTFSPGQDGRTRLKIERAGKELLSLK